MQSLEVDVKTTKKGQNVSTKKENKAIASSVVSFLESPMKEKLVKFYQHVIKFSHVCSGFHHHFFWVSTSFSGWAGAQWVSDS